MLDDLESSREISVATRTLLLAADAYGRLPTPIDDIVSARELVLTSDSAFSERELQQAPPHLRQAVMSLLKTKVRAILDRKERVVHLHPGIRNAGRRAFIILHEVSHDIFPWQKALGYADDDCTLAWEQRQLFEREANRGAVELLFQHDLFRDRAAEYGVGMASVVELHEMFGSSIRATVRQYAETHRGIVAAVVMESVPCIKSPLAYRRLEAVGSPGWVERFGSPHLWPATLADSCYPFIPVAECVRLGLEPPTDTFLWPDINNEPVQLKVEAISTGYNVMILLWVPTRELFKRRRVLAQTASG